jgi:soluble lytic murein transglycosylase
MSGRKWAALLIGVLCLILVPILLETRSATPSTHAAPSPSAAAAAATATDPRIPGNARAALKQQRYFVASRLLHDHLTSTRDSSAEALLLTAQADAGWQNWRSVRALLGGRTWLDSIGGAKGWDLLGRAELALGEYDAADRDLAQYVERAKLTDSERGTTELRRGIALSRSKHPADAVAAYERAAKLLPYMAEWSHVLAARAAGDAGDTAIVRSQLASVDSALALDWGWRAYVAALQKSNALPDAAVAAERAAPRLTSSSRRAEAWALAGTLRLQAGDTLHARDAFRHAVEQAILSKDAAEAARQLTAMQPTPDDQLRIARLLLRNGDYERGSAALRSYASQPTVSADTRAQLQMELGHALFRGARFADAIHALQPVASDTTRPVIAAEALYLIGRSQYRSGQQDAARNTFAALGERFPTQPPAADALFFLADLAHDAGNLDTASALYRRVIAAQPKSDNAALSYMRLGVIDYTRKDYPAAARIFDEYRQASGSISERAQAAYWAARAYAEAGQKDLAPQRLREVRQLEPMSYYGIRAADRLGTRFMSNGLAAGPPPLAVPPNVAGALQRIDVLDALDMGEAANYEVARLRQGAAGHIDLQYALAEALNARAHTDEGITLGREILRASNNTWNNRLLRIIYPLPYYAIIRAESKDNGLDAYLTAGLIRQESMFNADAISAAGAVGLMQVMPGTGKTLASTMRVSGFDKRMLENPEVNAALGTSFVAELMKQNNQRVTPVLAAYNAGPARLARWQQFPEFKDEETFAERIPFDETRDYVRIVQSNARIYGVLYPRTTPGTRTGE